MLCQTDLNTKKNSFEVQTQDRVYRLFADTEKKREEWMTAIHRAASLHLSRSRSSLASSSNLGNIDKATEVEADMSNQTSIQNAGTTIDNKLMHSRSLFEPTAEAPPEVRPVIGAGAKAGAGDGSDDTQKLITRMSPFLEVVAEYLVTSASRENLLFQRSGISYEVRLLHEQFSQEGKFSAEMLASLDPHSVAHCFKAYLRDQMEPVIPYSLFQRYVRISENEGTEEERWKEFVQMAAEMPVDCLKVLVFLLAFLARIVEAQSQLVPYDMAVERLAIIFGPILAPSINWPQHYPNLCGNAQFLLRQAYRYPELRLLA